MLLASDYKLTNECMLGERRSDIPGANVEETETNAALVVWLITYTW